MSKMLNLDELANEERVLKLNGSEHVLRDVSVGDFIEITRMTEGLKDDLPISDQLEMMVSIIKRRFPTVDEEELAALNMRQLNAILEFARQGDGQPDDAGSAESSEGSEKK